MQVKPIKTKKIKPNDNLFAILDEAFPKIEEKSIIAIASKIVGICEGRIVPIENEANKDEQKTEIAKQEADYYLPRKYNQYGFMITINHNIMVASAGVDESNSENAFALWPKDPQKSVNEIREYLVEKHNLKHLGIILTDSKLTPLRWGVTGVSLSHSGFAALKNYIGEPDIYGKKMHAEKANIADSLATAAVICMGEGNEQQPLALITDIPFVAFQQRNPTDDESLKIDIQDDVYASLLMSVNWQKKQ